MSIEFLVVSFSQPSRGVDLCLLTAMSLFRVLMLSFNFHMDFFSRDVSYTVATLCLLSGLLYIERQ